MSIFTSKKQYLFISDQNKIYVSQKSLVIVRPCYMNFCVKIMSHVFLKNILKFKTISTQQDQNLSKKLIYFDSPRVEKMPPLVIL